MPHDRLSLATEAAAMRRDGLTVKEIAGLLGVSRTYAYDLLNDPDGSKTRERKRRYDRVCVSCGGRADGTSPGRSPAEAVCAACARAWYKTWTPEAIVLAIEEWAEEHGGIPPSANAWTVARVNDKTIPTVNTVRSVFGSWNAAIRAAGFEPHAIGPLGGGHRPLTEDQRRECARRYAQGESTVQIAADFGCSPAIVAKWVRRAGIALRPSPFGPRAAT